jgi:hypothetical protein
MRGNRSKYISPHGKHSAYRRRPLPTKQPIRLVSTGELLHSTFERAIPAIVAINYPGLYRVLASLYFLLVNGVCFVLALELSEWGFLYPYVFPTENDMKHYSTVQARYTLLSI